MSDTSTVLWNQDSYVDDGDMDAKERAVLIALVKRLFITKFDDEWRYLLNDDVSRIRRDLSNLGLSLIVEERYGVAWAEQVPRELRGTLPPCRREAYVEKGHVAHAALCLRRHWDVCESRGEVDPHITDDELRAIVESGPLGSAHKDDGEALERDFSSVRDRLVKIGLLRLDSDSGTYRLMPTILVLIDNDFCMSVIKESE